MSKKEKKGNGNGKEKKRRKDNRKEIENLLNAQVSPLNPVLVTSQSHCGV